MEDMTETNGPTGGTYTWTVGNGLSDPVPYNATAKQSNAAISQAQERNTLKGPAARALGIPLTEAPSPEDYVDDLDWDDDDIETAAEFDAAWEESQPVDTYDWADDPNMSAEETLRRIEALGPDVTIGPDS